MQVKVKVLEIDKEREKVSLGMKTGDGGAQHGAKGAVPMQRRERSESVKIDKKKDEDVGGSTLKGNIVWG